MSECSEESWRVEKVVLIVLVLGTVGVPAGASVATQPSPDTLDTPARYSFDVTGDPLPEALDRFVKVTGTELVYATDLVTDKRTRCRIEHAPAQESLRCLLRETGISVERRREGRFVLTSRPDTSRYTLNGYVVDGKSGEVLPGANLYVPDLRRGTSTNEHGFYSLTLPADSVQLVVSYLGYEKETLSLLLRSNRRLTVELTPSTVSAGSLEVTADRVPLQQTSRMSTIEVSAQEVKQMPTLMGQTDLLKTLQRMPGVQSGVEGTSGMYVRGGTPDQNLILLDGAPLYNVSHVFGFVSVFNPDIVKNVRMTKGGFPARYGGHLSSVLEVSVEDGNRKDYDVEGSLGLVASRLTIQGPIVEDRTSFLLAGRRTYLDWLMRGVSEEDLDGGYYFYDVNAKVNHRFSASNRVFFSLYTGDDRFYNREDDGSASTNFGWGNITSTLRWDHVFDGELFGSATLRYSRYQFDVNANNDVEDGSYTLAYRSGIRDVGLKAHGDYDPNPRHAVRTGLDLTYHRFRPGATQYKNEGESNPSLDTTIVPSDPVRAVDASVYVEDDVTWTEQFKTNVGLRASGFFVQGDRYLSVQPRLSARYLLPNDWALKGSYAWMRQPIHLLTNSSVGLPTDLWVSSTDEVPPERSHQVAMGISRSFLDHGLDVSVEGYGKLMRGLIEYEQGASFSLTTSAGWEDQIETGRGWAYGTELLVRRKRGRVTGWLGYTISWTRRQFDALNDGEPFPFRYDRRHDLTATASYELTDITTLTGTWTYRTGTAVTLPQSRYRTPELYNFGTEGFGEGGPGSDNSIADSFDDVQSYGERNGYRMRPYHRLDLGLNFKWGSPDGFHALKTGVYNAYNRKNPFFLITEETESGALQGTSISVLPVVPYVSYRFKF